MDTYPITAEYPKTLQVSVAPPMHFTSPLELAAAYQQQDELVKYYGEEQASLMLLRFANDCLHSAAQTAGTDQVFAHAHERGIMDIMICPLNKDSSCTSSSAVENAVLAWYQDHDVRVIMANALTWLDNKLIRYGRPLDASFWEKTPGGSPGRRRAYISVIPGVDMECDLFLLRAGIKSSWSVICVLSVTERELRRVRCLVVNTLHVFHAQAKAKTVTESAMICAHHKTTRSSQDDKTLILEVMPNAPPGNTCDMRGLAVFSSYSLDKLRQHRLAGAIPPGLPFYGRTMDDETMKALGEAAAERIKHVPDRDALKYMTDPAPSSRHTHNQIQDMLEELKKHPDGREKLQRELTRLAAKDKESEKAFGSALASGMSKVDGKLNVDNRLPSFARLSENNILVDRAGLIAAMEKTFEEASEGETKESMRIALSQVSEMSNKQIASILQVGSDNATLVTQLDTGGTKTESSMHDALGKLIGTACILTPSPEAVAARNASRDILQQAVDLERRCETKENVKRMIEKAKEKCDAERARETFTPREGHDDAQFTDDVPTISVTSRMPSHEPEIGNYESINGALAFRPGTEMYRMHVKNQETGELFVQHMCVPTGLAALASAGKGVECANRISDSSTSTSFSATVELQQRIAKGPDVWMETLLKATCREDLAVLASDVGTSLAALCKLKNELSGVMDGSKPMPILVGRDGKRPKLLRDRSIGQLYLEFDLGNFPESAALALEDGFRGHVRNMLYHFACHARDLVCSYGNGDAGIPVDVEPLTVHPNVTTGRDDDFQAGQMSCIFSTGSALEHLLAVYHEVHVVGESFLSTCLIGEYSDRYMLWMCCSAACMELPDDQGECTTVLHNMTGRSTDDVWYRVMRAVELLHWQAQDGANWQGGISMARFIGPPISWLKHAVMDHVQVYGMRLARHLEFKSTVAERGTITMPDFITLRPTRSDPGKIVFSDEWWAVANLQWGLGDQLERRRTEWNERVVKLHGEGIPQGYSWNDVHDAALNGDWKEAERALSGISDGNAYDSCNRATVKRMLGGDKIRDVEPPFIDVHIGVMIVVDVMSSPSQGWTKVDLLNFIESLVCRCYSSEVGLTRLFCDEWRAIIEYLQPPPSTTARRDHIRLFEPMLSWWVWTVAALMSNTVPVNEWPATLEKACPLRNIPAFTYNCASALLTTIAAKFDAQSSYLYLVSGNNLIISSAIGTVGTLVWVPKRDGTRLVQYMDNFRADNPWREILLQLLHKVVSPLNTPPLAQLHSVAERQRQSAIPGVSQADISDLLSMSQDDVRRLAGPISASSPSKAEGKKVQPSQRPRIIRKPGKHIVRWPPPPPKSQVTVELEAMTDEMRTELVPGLKKLLAAIDRDANDCEITYVDLNNMGTDFEDALDNAHDKYEHKVTGEAWLGFTEFEAYARGVVKKALTDKKKREKQDEAERKKKTEDDKARKEYEEFVNGAARTLALSTDAWDLWIDSRHTNTDKRDEGISRLKTAKKNLLPKLKEDQQELKDMILTALKQREDYEKDRKRREREQARAEEAATLPPVPEPVIVDPEPEPAGGSSSGSSPIDPPVVTLTPADKRRAAKERRNARKAEEAEAERQTRLRQQEEINVIAAMEASRLEAIRVERERALAEASAAAAAAAAAEVERHRVERHQELPPAPPQLRPSRGDPSHSFMMRRVSHVGPNGHESQRLSSDPRDWAAERLYQAERIQQNVIAHWEAQSLQQQREREALARAPPAPIITAPTLAALAGSSSAPPESTIGDARCAICMDEEKDQLFLPCKHVACCHSCASKIMKAKKECPLCRAPIKKLIGGVKF